MPLILPNQQVVLNAYAVLIGQTPGNAALEEHVAYINANGTAAYKTALNSIFAGQTTAQLAATLMTNLGLTGVTGITQAEVEAYLGANASNRVGAMIDIANALFNLPTTGNASLDAAHTAYVNAINGSYNYSIDSTHITGTSLTGSVVTGGQTLTLTTGIDTLVGTSGDDTFIASSDGGATSTSNLGDTINGGAGTDTVKVYSNAAATVIPNLTGVEKLWIQDTVHESNDVSAITGLINLALNSGTTVDGATITQTLGAGQSLTLASVTDGDAGAAALADGGISIAQAASITSLDLNLDGVGAQTAATANNALDLGLAGTGLATLNVAVTGTNNIGLANAGGALATVNVSGAGSLTVWGTTAATITTFNAASNSGGVTVDLSASTGANQTVTGGSGNDTLTVDLAQNITLDAGAGNDVVTLANPTAGNLSSTAGAADSIKGGEGTDTLSLTAAGFVALAGDAAADRAVITGFEQVRVGAIDADTDVGAGFNAAISAFGLNYLQVNGDITDSNAGTAQTATVSGFTSGATVEFRAANATAATQVALNVGMTGATNAGTPDDLLNLKLNADLANQATAGAVDTESVQIEVGISGINKLAVSTADRVNTDGATARDDGYTLTLSNDNSMTLLTVTGDRELSFTSTASTAALATVNAADLSGDLILNLAVNGLTQGVVVTGGSGANTITGTGFADTITGGARADTITLGAGADTVTGGAGADTFVVVAADYTAATAAALATAADTITDFAKASDIIDWDAALTVQTSATASAGVAAVNAEGIATFNAADDTLAEMITAAAGSTNSDGDFVIFTFGSDTYVYINSNADSAVSAGDALIKLTGVTGLTDSTINAGNNLTIA